MDLREAKLELPVVNWHKARGTAGSAEAVLELAGNRPRALPKLDVRAGTLRVTGRARFDREGRTIESATFDRVSFGPDRDLRNVSIDLARSQAGWELIKVAGEVVDRPGARHSFALDYGPAATGIYELSAHAEDLGSTLRAFGLHDGIAGGRLTLRGQGERPGPGSPIQTSLEVTDFTLLEAPVLAQILAGTSISGWRNLLGDGVTFDRLWGDLRLEDSTVSTSSLRAVGGSLGLTAKGRVDVASGTLAVNGLVVPAYELNQILGVELLRVWPRAGCGSAFDVGWHRSCAALTHCCGSELSRARHADDASRRVIHECRSHCRSLVSRLPVAGNPPLRSQTGSSCPPAGSGGVGIG